MKNLNQEKGVTIIELLISLVLVGVLGLAFVSLQSFISKNQILVWNNYVAVDDANNSIKQMVKELRTARNGDNGAYPMEAAFDSEIIFFSDIDSDGASERVRYFLSGTDFYKGVVEPVGYPVTYPLANEKLFVITGKVRNGVLPVFTYYNGDWPEDTVNNPLPSPVRLSDTKLMKVSLRLNARANEPEKDYILESYVQVRMLKENL